MIISFKNRETARIYARQWSRRLPTDIQRVALRKLKMLNNFLDVEIVDYH